MRSLRHRAASLTGWGKGEARAQRLARKRLKPSSTCQEDKQVTLCVCDNFLPVSPHSCPCFVHAGVDMVEKRDFRQVLVNVTSKEQDLVLAMPEEVQCVSVGVLVGRLVQVRISRRGSRL